MAFDQAHSRVVAFGGTCDSALCGFNEFLADTWLWDGTNWTMAATSGPVGRRDASMAYDTFRGQIVLFGGQTQISSGEMPYLNDTWLWNGTTWSQDLPSMVPSAREFVAMAYDAARSQVVLFGGEGVGGIGPLATLGDTWVWGIP